MLGAVCALLALVAVAAPVGLGAIAARERATRAAVARVEHTQEVIAAIEQVMAGVEHAESDASGFVLTGDPTYIEPLGHASVAAWRSLSEVRRLTADTPHLQGDAQRLAVLLRDRLAVADRITELARSGDVRGAADVVRGGEGKRLTDAIRAATEDMAAEERVLIQKQNADKQEVEFWWAYALTGLAVAATCGSLLSGAALARSLTGSAAAKRAAAAVAAEHQRLLDLAPIMVRDFDGTIRFWSEGCRLLYGMTAEQAVGQSSHELLQTVFPTPRSEIEAALLRDGEWIGELRHVAQDGAEVIVAARKVLHRAADGSGLSVMETVTEATALRRAEAALRDSQARLRLVQQVGGIGSSDRALSEPTAEISDEFANLYGLPTDQTRISHAEWLDLVHPDDRGRVACQAQVLTERESAVATQFRIRRRDGAERWIAMRGETLRESGGTLRLISAHRDITDAVAAREALAARGDELERLVFERTAALTEAEAQFRTVFDSQFQFTGLLALDGTMLLVNRTALVAGGLACADVIGRPFWETGWWPPAEREQLRAEIVKAAGGALVRREVKVQGAGGRGIWIDFSLKPVQDPLTLRPNAIVAEGRDVTERRELADQLGQSQKVHALGQLAGGIAHDFNNILQSVSGAAMLIERRPEDHERTRRLARASIAAAERGASITKRLLAFARRGELRTEVVATAELLNGVREVLSHTLGTDITVRTDLPGGLPPLLTDRGQLETALVNLGTNARDAMPDGGPLTLSAEAVDLADGIPWPAGLAPGAYVRISVADSGSGMDAATLARSAEPFFTTKAPGHGTGLGLAMVRSFAEQARGAMTITSAPGAGTTVSLWLPQSQTDAVSSQTDENGVRPIRSTPARILLVDDDDLVRETLAAQIEDMGLGALVAASGSEALALMEAGETVDALVSDLSMPEMNGVTTIQKARALRPGLPCFLLTGYVGERAAVSAGDAFTLVRKPISGRTLVTRVEAGLKAAGR
jgi:PAS domain S-box-containing protein